ncbi:hypothetical protein [Spirillospora sp. NPDC029432]|uniref:hypothetical protein n=1 Tax=Spirillospora sp. NPDC029432 TaxID=3154599 RepID=UPI0034538B4D
MSGRVRLYSWTVVSRRAAGVTDSPAMAAGHVADELAQAPAGAEGSVRRVALASAHAQYVDLGEVARARREDGGTVHWEVV